MHFFKFISSPLVFVFIVTNLHSTTYNSHGQTGLINLPSAEIHADQSIYFTFNKSSFYKLATITATPFHWLEASYFYYRPDDLMWGTSKGFFLDKGFNVKFSYKPKSNRLPRFAIGLDDFAGTGQFTREYITSTYDFNNLKLTYGLGWGKYVGQSSIKNPLRIIDSRYESRSNDSDNYDLGGNLSYDLWFRGDSVFFGGIELKSKSFRNISYKLESNPFDYFKYGCCGEGLSSESYDVRKKDSDFNYGISYKVKDYGNINFSYLKGNTWNISFSIGFSSKKPLRKKNKFRPDIKNTEYNQNVNNEFYLDLLENLNRNKLFLQSASLNNDDLSITIDSSEHFNPIVYSSRAAYIAKKVSEFNELKIDKIGVGHINRGSQINNIRFLSSDLNLNKRYPNILIERNTTISDPLKDKYLKDEFIPKVNFPIYYNRFAPDIRTHVGSPEKVLYIGFGIRFESEIQINRNTVIYMNLGRSLKDNFDEKVSVPNSLLEKVRTEIVDYLQESSDKFYISNLDIETIRSPLNNVWTKLNIGYLEQMYGGISGEVLYKPFNSNFAISMEYNSLKKRDYDQGFSFQDYKVATSHINVAYYEPKTNILAKWSYGKYLAGDKGYTLDLSRRMPSGWTAGFFFTRTNVSADLFGEGSFDKGFYFSIPLNVTSKGYSKDSNGLKLRTMTRDGGQKLNFRNKLIDSFYGATINEINENWNEYLH